MTLQQKMKVEKTIQTIALQEGMQPQKVRQAMQEALDNAWTAGHAPGNIHAQLAWQRLFPTGSKPSVEEFILVISKSLK